MRAGLGTAGHSERPGCAGASWSFARRKSTQVGCHSAKRAPIFGRLESGFLYATAAHSRRFLQNQLGGLAFHAAGLSGPLGSGWSAHDPGPGARVGKPTLPAPAGCLSPADVFPWSRTGTVYNPPQSATGAFMVCAWKAQASSLCQELDPTGSVVPCIIGKWLGPGAGG